jgi:hypothetical protein
VQSRANHSSLRMINVCCPTSGMNERGASAYRFFWLKLIRLHIDVDPVALLLDRSGGWLRRGSRPIQAFSSSGGPRSCPRTGSWPYGGLCRRVCWMECVSFDVHFGPRLTPVTRCYLWNLAAQSGLKTQDVEPNCEARSRFREFRPRLHPARPAGEITKATLQTVSYG